MADDLNHLIKELATPFEAFDGAVVFWMLGFNNLESGIRRGDFEAIKPPHRYTHKKTGEETTNRPSEAELEQYEVRDLWATSHFNFVLLEPRTAAVDFHLTDTSPASLKAFAEYWQNAPHDLAERWQWWCKLVDVSVVNAWIEAYAAAESAQQASSPPPKVEVGSGNPLPKAAGSPTKQRSSGRSRNSPVT